jgi:hypothetical protein
MPKASTVQLGILVLFATASVMDWQGCISFSSVDMNLLCFDLVRYLVYVTIPNQE